MQPNNKLCNTVVKDGTNQSQNINEIYNVRLYHATNFLNAPRNVRIVGSCIFAQLKLNLTLILTLTLLTLLTQYPTI